MPKAVDHEARRTGIISALIRLAAREGLHAVTMRAVAREAGVSVRLVQYYFHSKSELMLSALRRLEEESRARWATRLERLAKPRSLRSRLEKLFAEALPSDVESRTFHLVWTSYAVLAMTDPELAGPSFIEGPARLEQDLAEALRQGQAAGEVPADVDAALEAALLTAITHGIGTSVLVGQRSAEAAMTILTYHLDRLFR